MTKVIFSKKVFNNDFDKTSFIFQFEFEQMSEPKRRSGRLASRKRNRMAAAGLPTGPLSEEQKEQQARLLAMLNEQQQIENVELNQPPKKRRRYNSVPPNRSMCFVYI